MPLETASHIASLNATNPASGDAVAQADDHLRLIKSVLLTDFATINSAITATPTQINSLGSILNTQLDRSGSLTTTNTATQYNLATNTVFASLAAMNGKAIIFKPHVTSGAAPTLNVDGLGAIALKSIAGTVIPTGALLIGGRYAVTYNDSATEFVVHGIFGVLPATTFSGAVTVSAGGVNVTGASTFNDLATFSGGSSNPATFSWNDAGAVVGPTLDVFRDSASPAVNDVLGTLDINGRDSAGNKQLYARYGALITSPTSTTEGSNFYVQTMVAGAVTTVLQSSGADIALPGNLVVTGSITGRDKASKQYLTSGTGATYTTPAGCRVIRVHMIGGGGGGGAANTNAGSTGGTTTFNSINAVGGSGGQSGATVGRAGGIGGTGGTGSASQRFTGSAGSNGSATTTGGGNGGPGLLGAGAGLGAPAATAQNGNAAAANTGAGGGGAATATNAAGGGGAGEYVEIVIASPSGTYTYTVGAVGAGGPAGTNAGGNGGTGMIMVEEYY